jgi:hypothetical protein
MAVDSAVVFEGRRWPGACLPARPPYWRDGDRTGYVFAASGKGQQWSTDRPLAFWRNFSALNLPDEKAVLRLLTRHGDPTGEFDRRAAAREAIVAIISSWEPLITALKQVAAAWGEPDVLGISHPSNDSLRVEAADKALRKLLPTDPDGDREISKEVEVAYTPRGLTLRPRTLRAFMVVSAASARERRINMRECLLCRDWFELRRSDAFYCSGSCQAVDHKRRSTATNSKRVSES